MAYTSDLILANIRRRGFLPTTSSTGTGDSDLLTLCDEETTSYIAPLVLSVRENHYLFSEDVALSSGVLSYRIPYRAIGSKLRELALVSADGKSQKRLPQVEVSDLENVIDGFWVSGASIILAADPLSTSNLLRMRYFMRPNRLVASSAVTTAASVTGAAVSLSTVPAGYTSASLYDLVKASPPFETLGYDLAGTVSGSTLTLTAGAVTGFAKGDYVCLAETTAIPQMPAELHPLLEQRVVSRAMEAMGDQEGMQNSQASAARLEEAALRLLASRVDASPKKVIARNSPFRSVLGRLLNTRH